MPQTRRQFLSAAGSAIAAAGVFTALPPSIAKALSIRPAGTTGTIRDVEHVVVLMQENRSFDHYFGGLAGVRGFGDRFTIPLPDGRTVWEQSGASGVVTPYHLDSTVGNAQRVDGTPHSWRDSQDAWDAGRMSEWALHKEPHSMGYYTEAELGYQYALAEAFTLCDAYHCSVQAGTNPNRLFLFTGSNGPTPAGVAAVVNEWDSLGPPSEGYDWPTFPERLEDAGVSWKVYQFLPDNFGDNSLAGFLKYRDANEKMGNGPDGAPYTTYDASYEEVDPLIKGISNTMPDEGFLEAFRADIAAGTLPAVSWIVGPAEYSEHPGPSSPVQGAAYIEEVLNSLTDNPDVWARTVLLVNFDENDGFFDHVPPPAPPSLSEDGTSTGASTVDVNDEYFTHPNPAGTSGQPAPDGGAYGLGPRVPLYVISPWSAGGWVNSQVFDHTSVIRFIEERFGVSEPNISAWRRTVCGDLTTAFDFATAPAAAPTLPTFGRRQADLVRLAQERLPQVPTPGEPLPLPVASGSRPSRALPYDLAVSSHLALDAGVLELTFTNSGAVGAVFHVYDRLHLDRVPRRYTVGSAKELVGEWSLVDVAGRYDLWILGPNGFHRAFAGTVGTGPVDDEGTVGTPAEQASLPEVATQFDSSKGVIRLMLRNHGTADVEFEIADAAYGAAAAAPVIVRPGASATVDWTTSDTQGWYDIAVTAANDNTFARRLAGRIESGDHGVSDPALGMG